jgi:ADP-ribose pyrophosphatase YjhB (NUDIX family)
MIKKNNVGSYFQAQIHKPAHLSVGAIVYDSSTQKYILLHKPTSKGKTHTFPTKTHKEDTPLEDTLKRCLSEELGVEGEIITYVGSLQTNDIWFAEIEEPTRVQKTSAMFLVKLSEYKPETRSIGEFTEDESSIVQKTYDDLMDIFRNEHDETGYDFFNFSQLLKTSEEIIQILSKSPDADIKASEL